MQSETEEFGPFATGAYVRRIVDQELDALEPHLPAILLEGPKAVGKTATALERSKTTVWLSRPEVASIARSDPDALLVGDTPILIDEWQNVPTIWDSVKLAVDRNRAGGQFFNRILARHRDSFGSWTDCNNSDEPVNIA